MKCSRAARAPLSWCRNVRRAGRGAACHSHGLKDPIIGLLVACGLLRPALAFAGLPAGEAVVSAADDHAGRACARAVAPALVLGALVGAPTAAKADEGGVSFWVPGFFGSLAASPLVPGFAFTNIGYNTSVKAGADVAFARQVTRGNLAVNFSGNLNANLDADAL